MSSSLFHYTSLDAFQKMFTGELSRQNEVVANGKYQPMTSITVHFSHIRYMNDMLEYEFFNNLLWKAIRKKDTSITKNQYNAFVKIIKFFSEPFIFSLSEKIDFLPMWKMYSDDAKGVMIEFDKYALTQYCKERNYSLGKCVYTENLTEDELITECVSYIHQKRIDVFDIIRSMKLNLRKNLVLYKSPDFNYEKEWRIYLRTNIVLTKVSQGVVKQYTDAAIPASCIKSVTLAPCCPYAEEQKESIAHLLSTKGLSGDKMVHNSIIVGYRNL